MCTNWTDEYIGRSSTAEAKERLRVSLEIAVERALLQMVEAGAIFRPNIDVEVNDKTGIAHFRIAYIVPSNHIKIEIVLDEPEERDPMALLKKALG